MLRFPADNKEALAPLCEILRHDGVVAVPTETVYGLVCLWNSHKGRERIYELKARPAQKRLQMLAPSVSAAIAAGLQDDPRLERLANAFWPGALTVVAKATGEYDSIGLRIPAHPFVLALLEALGEPLAATSANLSGQPAGLTAEEAIKGLTAFPDALVDGGSVRETGGTASTVVSLLGDTPTILREGPISLAQIEAITNPQRYVPQEDSLRKPRNGSARSAQPCVTAGKSPKGVQPAVVMHHKNLRPQGRNKK